MRKNVFAVFIGGAIGSLSRYGINLGSLAFDFPVGTLVENLIGSFLLGLLSGWIIYCSPKEWVKAGLGVGLCGGFTTMSTLAGDSFFLLMNVSVYSIILYISSSVVGGLLCAFSGMELGRLWAAKYVKKGMENK